MNHDDDHDFEDYLRSARPAEPPPELLRRLRHAEPVSTAPWWRWQPLAAIAVAAMILLAILVGSRRLLPENLAAPRRPHTVSREDVPADDTPPGFGGSVALNIRLGASPDLIPISLRPDYDPRAPHSPAGLLVADPLSESLTRF